MAKKHKKEEKIAHKSSEEKLPEPSKLQKIRPSLISWIVFFFTISIVIISLIPVVFPALIATSFTTVNDLEQFGISGGEVDPFEAGPLAAPLFITSAIIFGLAILHFKNKIPQLSKAFEFIFNFEVSKKIAIITMIVILAVYIAASAPELSEEQKYEDYVGVKNRIDTWSPDQITGSFEPHVRYFFIWSSTVLFGNDAVVPFLASIALLIIVYFFTKEITKKKICRNSCHGDTTSKQSIFDF